MEKPAKFNRHQNVQDLLEQIDLPDLDLTINDSAKFLVKVGNQFGARSANPRFKLQDDPYYFYREPEAYDCKRFFKGAELVRE